MKQIFLGLFLSWIAPGQNVNLLIQLKHVTSDSVMPVLATFGRGSVISNQEPRGRYVTVSGPAELIAEIQAAIVKIDVPAPPLKNVESTFHILLASNAGESTPLPKELDGVATQLRGMFGYKSLRLLETALLRGRANSGSDTSGLMPPPGKVDAPAKYHVRYGTLNVTNEEKVLRARYNALRISFGIPMLAPDGKIYDRDMGINTDIDIREGQKVVVGKTSIDTTSQSLFVVVSAKIVD
ncbi:MAG: hypothetical protein FJW30_07090 [Acidobacteria bacterium]|nr:hypothetical protein [Acidobacteriota bacterium]